LEGPAGSATSPNLTLSCNPPVLTTFIPFALSGKSITMTGQNFTGSNSDSSFAVFFSGIRSTTASAGGNALTASATVPGGAPKGPITVQNAYGSTTSVTNFSPLGSIKGDFDFDSRADVIFRHQGAGNVLQWMMNGAF